MARKKPQGVYLELQHGRPTPQTKLNGWGKDGPVLGPFLYVHTTYGMTVRAGDLDGAGTHDFEMHDGMLYYSGMYYGDWTVQPAEQVLLDKQLRTRTQYLEPGLLISRRN